MGTFDGLERMVDNIGKMVGKQTLGNGGKTLKNPPYVARYTCGNSGHALGICPFTWLQQGGSTANAQHIFFIPHKSKITCVKKED